MKPKCLWPIRAPIYGLRGPSSHFGARWGRGPYEGLFLCPNTKIDPKPKSLVGGLGFKK